MRNLVPTVLYILNKIPHMYISHHYQCHKWIPSSLITIQSPFYSTEGPKLHASLLLLWNRHSSQLSSINIQATAIAHRGILLSVLTLWQTASSLPLPAYRCSPCPTLVSTTCTYFV
jgi:hypothetical protein